MTHQVKIKLIHYATTTQTRVLPNDFMRVADEAPVPPDHVVHLVSNQQEFNEARINKAVTRAVRGQTLVFMIPTTMEEKFREFFRTATGGEFIEQELVAQRNWENGIVAIDRQLRLATLVEYVIEYSPPSNNDPPKPCDDDTDLNNFKEALRNLVRETTNPYRRTALFKKLKEEIRQVLNQTLSCAENIKKLLQRYLATTPTDLNEIRHEFKELR